MKPQRPPYAPLELLAAGAALLLAWHLLALRIRAGGLPMGDEGSWIAVAAELARGNGFTTRWLEGHFLTPYALPRPDDFRYPAMASLLALQFKLWGVSIETARWTAAAAWLAFAAAAWPVWRAAFGRFAAMAGLWLMAASLLQLEWNSAVYTEGLFGLAVTGLAAWCLRGEGAAADGRPEWRRIAWWAALGAGTGLLFLVRVNGILFLSGIAALWFLRRRELTLKHPAAACLAFALVASPWLIRNAMAFGNPFHFAGSGGLLRDPGVAATQSHTLGFFEYFGRHDALFPLRREVLGAWRFLRDLHAFEHGAQAAPLLLALAAAALRRRFFNPFLVAGFLLTFAACAYAAYNSWAGVRYMSSLLPFVYAYGLSILPPLLDFRGWFAGSGARARLAGALATGLGILLLLAPTIHPHRHYARKHSAALEAGGAYAYREPQAEHLAALEALLPPGGRYYAASLCYLNFLAPDRGCVGLQELYDPAWLPRSLEAFRPGLVALTRQELRDSVLAGALARLRAEGYLRDTLAAGERAVYFAVDPAGAGAAPDTARSAP